ncbi:MAG: hypothetical protein V4719_16575 [Planctomycetota bacterium]
MFSNSLLTPLLAADPSGGTRIAWEFGRESWQGLAIAAVAIALVVGWGYRRDTQGLHWFWRLFLLLLRMGVLASLGVIALDPQERTETSQVRPSRVALLLDTSVSMSFPEKTSQSGTPANAAPEQTRSDALIKLLQNSTLLEDLRRTHDVGVYGFDSKLRHIQNFNKRGTAPTTGAPASPTPVTPEPVVDWTTSLHPQGTETRLGEALLQLIREVSGETLSGVAVVTDGQSNAGVEVASARDAATSAKVRLIPIGVGGTDRPINVQIASTQAPTHVHQGDGFSITAFVQGQGLAGKNVQVELLSKMEVDGGPMAVTQTKDVTLLEDGVPATVVFDYQPTDSGRRMFNIRIKPPAGVRELTQEDNEKALPPVEITERKTKVLLIAGGPMRDYQFTRNLLFRDPGIELDVWLQTGRTGISQEASKLLFDFPATDAELFQYDVIVGFDPDWKLIPGAGREALSKWVFQHAGGLVLIAGDVFTSELASANADFQGIRSLYPVVLAADLFDFDQRSEEFQQPWPIEFTRPGVEAEFLQIDETPAASAQVWKQFAGVYRCYPTTKAKDGATVYAYFSDRRSADENGKPILLAGQFFGAGRVLYLGSPELWRLRAVDEKYFERYWIKSIREVGQGRLLRGTNRGVLLLERQTYSLGATVQIRANLLDQQFKELAVPYVDLEVVDPRGKRSVPPLRLQADKTRAGQFQGTITANLPGRYRLELPIPESTEQVIQYIQVEVPNLEFVKPEQDAAQLQRLATTELGGKYLPFDSAVKDLPALLPDRSTTKIQFDVPRALWDQQWVLYLLVGLLSAEWLTRKLLKLA